jgi:hypothetical protein
MRPKGWLLEGELWGGAVEKLLTAEDAEKKRGRGEELATDLHG